MTHALGNRRWTGTIASIGLLLAVTGCTASGPDGGSVPSGSSSSSASASASASSEAAAPTSSASSAPSSSPTPAPAEPSATPSATPPTGEAPSPSASPSTSPTDAPVPVPAPSPSSPPAAGGICTAAQLTGAVEDTLGGAGAGSVYRTLLLTNASDQPCTLEGYPGVSFVDASGGQLGAPAERDGSAPGAVTLAPGATAASTLRQTNAQNYGPECGLTTSAGLRVYPPGATDSLILPQEIAACTAGSISLMRIGTMQATS